MAYRNIFCISDTIQMLRMFSNRKTKPKLMIEMCYGCDFSKIKNYQLPIYYILGRNDEWTTSTIAAEYFETIQAPKKELYWIENAGHMVDTDNPAAFWGIIKEIVLRQ